MTRSLDEIEDYELKARLSIPLNHPHYDEVRSLLTAQVDDELNELCPHLHKSMSK
jgi:hypothetical protein